MKKFHSYVLCKPTQLTALFLIFIIVANAQDINLQLNPSVFDNGYNIRCHGSGTGSVEAVVINGNSPYSFSWSNGATTQNLGNITAGIYTLTVTDFNNETAIKEITLTEPDVMTVNLHPDIFDGGINISQAGASDGHVRSEIRGGAPPYTYLWSTASQEEELHDVLAGAYTLTVTDVNNCTSSSGVTLTEPTALHIVSITSPLHNGKNISCYAGDDGAIDLTVAGGISPYTYQWNNGSFEEDPQNLKARIYMVRVSDQNGAEVDGQITLTEPVKLTASFTISQYGNYNISSYGSANGYINTTVTGGITPYTYHWDPVGQTTTNISNLGPGEYRLIVTDANNCLASNNAMLTQPDFNDGRRMGMREQILQTSF